MGATYSCSVEIKINKKIIDCNTVVEHHSLQDQIANRWGADPWQALKGSLSSKSHMLVGKLHSWQSCMTAASAGTMSEPPGKFAQVRPTFKTNDIPGQKERTLVLGHRRHKYGSGFVTVNFRLEGSISPRAKGNIRIENSVELACAHNRQHRYMVSITSPQIWKLCSQAM